ncbi:ATP-binding protein [Ramlibacter sp. MMS24-I3-19]|uniref:PAS domain-containing sensor histidine kinase n=1 Tax=Ramlibacter sp. MMS24-I3-19 TaxID=3416606 RepID=UPI003D092896
MSEGPNQRPPGSFGGASPTPLSTDGPSTPPPSQDLQRMSAELAQATVEAQAAAVASGTWDDDRQVLLELDDTWTIVACNAGCESVLGHRAQDLLQQHIGILFDDTDVVDKLKDGHRKASGWMLRRDGLRMWADVTCSAPMLHVGGSPRRVLSAFDATLQYRASQALRRQADNAASSTAARDLFIGSIAHELRAALAPISTSAAIMDRQLVQPSAVPVPERLVGIVRRNAAAAARLIEDLLAYSTLSAGKLVLRPAPLNLDRLVADTLDSLRHAAQAKQVQLQEHLCAQARPVHADNARLEQVLLNLLGNAIKFTPAGGRVAVTTSCGPSHATVEISDTGRGIDPDVLPFIFDPFEQGGSDITGQHGGFGLGLAISAGIVAQHGGRLVATSDGRDRGATFRLSLPLGRQGEAPMDRPRAGPLRVLYVEDNLDAADAMRYALGTLGWQMVHAGTCAGARALVSSAGGAAFDVVLADLGLPDGSGLELGRDLSRDLPVVALTAYGAPLALQGFADQLIKPADICEVQRALLKAVATAGDRRPALRA